MSNESQQYELTFILGEVADEKAAEAKSADLKEVIKKLGGEVTKEEIWGRRELAYVIKRNRSGFYVTLWFSAPVNAVRPLEEHLRFDETVIRSLVTKAYKEAQPGTLSPVAEEEEKKAAKEARASKADEKASAEEMLRRSATAAPKKGAEEMPTEDALPEEERLKKLDETLEELLKD